MSKRLLFKLLTVCVLALLLKVPLLMISGVLEERVEQREAATNNVMQSTSGPQRVGGAVLVIPYRVRHVRQEKVPTQELVPLPSAPAVKAQPTAAQAALSAPSAPSVPTARAAPSTPPAQSVASPSPDPDAAVAPQRFTTQTVIRVVTKESFTDHQLALLPDEFNVTGEVATTKLYRGIYGVPTFAADLKVTGRFTVDVGALRDDPNVTFGEPFVAVGLGDVRGLRKAPNFLWQGKPYAVQPGTQLKSLGEGVHAPLRGVDPARLATVPFALPLDLAGATNFSFAPMGRNARMDLRADWPHPSFFGRFLPTARTVDASGFTASWQTTALATNLGERFKAAHAKGRLLGHSQDVGVAFIEPVDHYSQTHRAIKYDLLFVVLTFSAFFLFEIVKQLRIHPMQYALVGAALATFYLLVIALSEHIGFPLAYASASAACVGLIGFYLVAVLGQRRHAWGFSALLATLYGALYGILQSEDQALLLGALLVFGGLATVMAATRRLDWYAVGQAPRPDRGPA